MKAKLIYSIVQALRARLEYSKEDGDPEETEFIQEALILFENLKVNLNSKEEGK